jgi:hypothetical protein
MKTSLLSNDVLLLHDLRAHIDHVRAEMIGDLHFECSPHPPYSHNFPNESIAGKTLPSDEIWEGGECMSGSMCGQKFFHEEGRH